MLPDSVQTGVGPEAPCQVSVAAAGAPAPTLLLGVTVYVTLPADADVAWQAPLVLAQPVQT